MRKLKSKIVRQLKDRPDNTLFTKLEHGKPRLYTYSNGKLLYLSQNSFPFSQNSHGQDTALSFSTAFCQYIITWTSELRIHASAPKCFNWKIYRRPLRDLRHSIKGTTTENSWNDQLLRYLHEEFLPAQQWRITERDIYTWRSIKYEGNPYRPDQKIHRTPGGIYVRSKSELLIATHLEYMDIPYRYEAPLFLEGNIVYPDFTILRSRW